MSHTPLRLLFNFKICAMGTAHIPDTLYAIKKDIQQ